MSLTRIDFNYFFVYLKMLPACSFAIVILPNLDSDNEIIQSDKFIKSKQDLIDLYSLEELTGTEQIRARYTFVYEFCERWYKLEKTRKAVDKFTDWMADKCKLAIWIIDWHHMRSILIKARDREEGKWITTTGHKARFNTFLLPKN